MDQRDRLAKDRSAMEMLKFHVVAVGTSSTALCSAKIKIRIGTKNPNLSRENI